MQWQMTIDACHDNGWEELCGIEHWAHVNQDSMLYWLQTIESEKKTIIDGVDC